MKSAIICFGLLLSARSVWAIHPASSDALAKIKSLIDQANRIDGSQSRDPNERTVQRIWSDLDSETRQDEELQNHAKVAALRSELKDLKKQRDVLYEKAIRLTAAAYEIVPTDYYGLPAMPTKEAVHPLMGHRMVQWIVVYKDDEPRTVQVSKGDPQVIDAQDNPRNPAPGGVTGADGVTTMHGQFGSPEALAFILFHEQLHYQQYTTKGQGDAWSQNKMELDVFEQQKYHLNEFGFDARFRDAYFKFLDGENGQGGAINKYHDLVRAEKWKGMLSLGFSSEGRLPDFHPRSAQEYDELEAHSEEVDVEMRSEAEAENSDLGKAVSSAIDSVRKESNEQQENQQSGVWLNGQWYPTNTAKMPLPAPQVPLPAASAPRADPYLQARAFRDLALKSCQSPGDVTQANIDWPGVFGTNREVQGAGDLVATLSGCPRYVFDRMMEARRAGGRMTVPMLAQWVSDSQPRPVTRTTPHRGGDESTPDDHCKGGEDQGHPRNCY